jgi:phosphatidylglycerol---prolipoprotein diacylglyceryl transferase
MENFLSTYQHLPSHINPIAFQISIFSVHWYSLMYLSAFLTVYLLLMYRIRKKEADFTLGFILDFMLYAIAGLLIGGRLGYVLFYNFSYFFQHPLEIILPIQVTSFGLQATGIYGMSFFGGVIGIILAGIIFVWHRRGPTSNTQIAGQRSDLWNSFWQLADFVAPAIPAGYFFGRIGNFLNGELYGRITQKTWGMYFPADPNGFLRHPSQLYEAFFEGLVVFAILWTIRNAKKENCHPEPCLPAGRLDSGSNRAYRLPQSIRFRIKSGMTEDGSLLLIYLFFYGLFRFFIEFFREPDIQSGLIFNFLTLNQIFALILVVISGTIYILKIKKNNHEERD